MFVIKRTDQRGGYVAIPGSEHSYTQDIRQAQVFSTRELADMNRCKGSEIVSCLANEMQGFPRR